MIAVGVAGAAGRMGVAACAAISSASDMELRGQADPAIGVELDAILGDCDVVVDFTRPDAALANARACVAAGVHVVIGTTGFDLDALSGLRGANVFAAPNFAIGAVLMMRFAAEAAAHMAAAEIIELHHDGKLDAPSGTARATAERMAAARRAADAGDFPRDRTVTEAVEGARGGEGPARVRLHSVRLPGLVAHQEVILGSVGQSLTIRHDSYDRSSFMDGVILAVRSVPDRPGVTSGLEPLLGL